MTQVSTFSYKNQDIDIILNRGKLAYTFEIKGKRYGNSVKVAGKKSLDFVAASIALIINYLETREAAEKL